MNLLSAAVRVVGDEKSNRKSGGESVPIFRGPEIDLLNSECLLDNLIPIGGTFHSEHFKRNPVVVRGNNKRLLAVKRLLFNLDIAELVKNTASERIHIWLSQKESEDALESISIEDHSQAIKLYGAGHSIYCRAPAELERSVVPKLLNDLGLGITGSGTDRYRRGEIEMFLSRKGHNTGTIIIKVRFLYPNLERNLISFYYFRFPHRFSGKFHNSNIWGKEVDFPGEYCICTVERMYTSFPNIKRRCQWKHTGAKTK